MPVEYCHPRSLGVPGRRRWLLVFEDESRGMSVYYDEDEAHEAFERANRAWNCHLFVSAEIKPHHEQTEEQREDDIVSMLRARQHDTDVAADDRDLMQKASKEIERLRLDGKRLQIQTFEIADMLSQSNQEHPSDRT